MLSCVLLLATPWTAACRASLSFTLSQSLLKLMSIESVMPFSHLILCRPLLLLSLVLPSIRVFSNESTLRMRWPKYWSFSFSISPSKEHPGLMSFRVDWLDLLVKRNQFISLQFPFICVLYFVITTHVILYLHVYLLQYYSNTEEKLYLNYS